MNIQGVFYFSPSPPPPLKPFPSKGDILQVHTYLNTGEFPPPDTHTAHTHHTTYTHHRLTHHRLTPHNTTPPTHTPHTYTHTPHSHVRTQCPALLQGLSLSPRLSPYQWSEPVVATPPRVCLEMWGIRFLVATVTGRWGLLAFSGQGSGMINVMQGAVLHNKVPPLNTDRDPTEELLNH